VKRSGRRRSFDAGLFRPFFFLTFFVATSSFVEVVWLLGGDEIYRFSPEIFILVIRIPVGH
jgi:hypothetical protein